MTINHCWRAHCIRVYKIRDERYKKSSMGISLSRYPLITFNREDLLNIGQSSLGIFSPVLINPDNLT